MKAKNRPFLMTSFIILFLLLILGATYAFFTAIVTDGDKGSSNIVKTGTLSLVYSDNEYVNNVGALPGSSYTKTVSVTNDGNAFAYYDLIWFELLNDFVTKSDLVMSITCTTTANYCEGLGETVIPSSGSDVPILYNVGINALETQTYTITITFKETGSNQNDNQGKQISGKIGVIDPHDRNLEIYGYVYDENSSAMQNVVVELHSDPISAITDEAGRYVISKAPLGDHTLYVKTNDKTSTIMTTPLSINLGTTTSSSNNNIIVSQTRRSIEANINKTATTAVVALATKSPGVLKGRYDDNAPEFYDYYNALTTVSIEDHIDIPSDAISTWDVSVDQNSSVMAFILPSQYPNTYKLFIQSENKLIAPQDSSDLFSLRVAEISGLEYVDTSNVINMAGMFASNDYDQLDLSSFDTSNVTDMTAMFYSNDYLTSLNLNNFDTSKVVDMSYMFFHNHSLISLDLSSFNTSNVTNMSNMFNCATQMVSYNNNNNNDQIKLMSNNLIDNQVAYSTLNSQLTSLNISSFDTSKVINMSEMFAGLDSIITLNLSNFITTSVTNMYKMFSEMLAIENLNINHFTFDSVSSYINMFLSSKNNLTIKVKNTDAQTFINSMLSEVSLTGSVNIG